jgi:hypothetical protein
MFILNNTIMSPKMPYFDLGVNVLSLAYFLLLETTPSEFIFIFTFQIKPCGKIAYGTTIFFLTPLQSLMGCLTLSYWCCFGL